MTDILQISGLPIFCNVLLSSREEAISAPRGDVLLGFCPHCGHVFNRLFCPELLEYSEGYENSLHFSPFFQDYAHWLANDLISRYDLHGKKVIEIGSGKGDFLRMLCQLGNNRGVGYDPSYIPQAEEQQRDAQVRFIQGFYSDGAPETRADLIYSRHTLEHMSDPVAFTRTVRRAIGEQERTAVFFEVPSASLIFQTLSVWDIIYEHFSYFSQSSLERLMSSHGFHVCKVYETYSGQFLCVEASPTDCSSNLIRSNDAERDRFKADVFRFPTNYHDKISRWQERFAEMHKEGKKAVVWGAGSKGVSFLNMLSGETGIEYLVDINPRKVGKFIPGTGQEIVPPQFLRTYQPDVVIVMNPNYRGEIADMARDQDLTVEFLLA